VSVVSGEVGEGKEHGVEEGKVPLGWRVMVVWSGEMEERERVGVDARSASRGDDIVVGCVVGKLLLLLVVVGDVCAILW